MNKSVCKNQEFNLANSKTSKKLFFVLSIKKFLAVLICLQFLFFPLNAISATKDGSCKNYTDCNYKEGSFCVNKNGKGACQKICPGGKVSPGLDNNGDSLPCGADFSYSGLIDLSGRKVCCPKKKQNNTETNKKNEDIQKPKKLGNLCKGSSDCKENEFCAYTQSSEARCGIYNCDGSYISDRKSVV